MPIQPPTVPGHHQPPAASRPAPHRIGGPLQRRATRPTPPPVAPPPAPAGASRSTNSGHFRFRYVWLLLLLWLVFLVVVPLSPGTR